MTVPSSTRIAFPQEINNFFGGVPVSQVLLILVQVYNGFERSGGSPNA